ncbi:transglycosylase domain-containing protein [Vagococcus salmoninarum]|uniref:transglycosylase domain-containing protein n=1 Tax=Vagococcus salmoninarum TaxID=2739 RepID=UPI00187F2536|nr:transglycosylase domain-containing protein [Vagococcus salmoninarum]MBE9390178.1 penicillin-binding protein [Vagococcus salmoninarum]
MLNKNIKEKVQGAITKARGNFSESEGTTKDKLAFAFNVTFEVMKSLTYFMISLGFLLGMLVAGVGIGYFAYLVSDTAVPDKKELQAKITDVEQISSITYAGGEKIADIKSDLIRTNVSSKNISPLVKQALIATEDEYFNVHKGVVPKAVIRALVSDATGIGGSSGGSTITQQLVKQQVLTSETSYKRKANEIILAFQVEKFFSKDEIITSYLNVSPFGRNNKGQNIAGVQEAAKGIFNTTAAELTLTQAAFIAGLPQSPIDYSPYTNLGELKEDLSHGLKRKDQVLYNLYKEEYISKKEYDEAIAYDLTKDFKKTESASDETNGYLYYYLQNEAVQILMPTYYKEDGLKKADIEENPTLQEKYYKIAERELRRSGYTVQSTIDRSVYSALQETTRNVVPQYVYDDQIQLGSVVMNNQTGRILGFVGGRDYNKNTNNHAFQTRRSPGSTIKPLLAYGPAIDQGLIGSESMLSDFPRKYRSGDDLKNYANSGSGKFVSVREALKQSLNIPVVNLYDEVLERMDPGEYYKKMNIPMTDAELRYESIPLGGTDTGPTVFEQTNAFATLANNGKYAKGYAIEKITDNEGNVIYQHKVAPVDVYSPATASIMTDMMRDVLNSGTGTQAKGTLNNIGSYVVNADWVGKTGTSQSYGDFWFIASTPTITVSSWIGYSKDTTPMSPSMGDTNMTLWAYLANAAYQANSDAFGVGQEFKLDSSVVQTTVSNITGQKKGNMTIDGYTRTDNGKDITSLWAVNPPTTPEFRFGLGGSDGNYKSAWDSMYVKPKPVTPPKPKDKKEDKKEENKDKKDDDKDN